MRILCVCKTDTCRSPMFAAVLRRHLGAFRLKRTTIESAGYLKHFKERRSINRWTQLEDETGIDLRHHARRWVGDLDLKKFDRIICVEGGAAEELKNLGLDDMAKVLPWPLGPECLPSTVVGTLKDYRSCYMEICSAVVRLPRSFLVQIIKDG